MRISHVGMRTHTLLLTAALGLVASLTGVARLAAEPDGSRVRDLQKKWLGTLQMLVKVTDADYRIGKVTFDRVCEVTRACIDAELELCRSDKERVTILENAVKFARDHEKSAEQRYRVGKVSQSDVLMAQAYRLEAEIALERARAKATPPK